MRDSISNQEYHQWRAFDTYREAMREHEANKATATAKVKRGKR